MLNQFKVDTGNVMLKTSPTKSPPHAEATWCTTDIYIYIRDVSRKPGVGGEAEDEPRAQPLIGSCTLSVHGLPCVYIQIYIYIYISQGLHYGFLLTGTSSCLELCPPTCSMLTTTIRLGVAVLPPTDPTSTAGTVK
jgi:hypothetical protein